MTTILEALILSLINPVGFLILMLLILFLEYLIGKSIMKDMRAKETLPSFMVSQLKSPDIALKKNVIGIEEAATTTNVPINYIVLNKWFNK